MKKVHAVLFAGTVLAALAGAAPAYATVAACSFSNTSAINPLTNTNSIVTQMFCPAGPPGGSSLTNPMAIGGIQQIFTVAPPDNQFYEFSTPASILDISFVSQDTVTYSGLLSLYNSSDTLVKSATITSGFGLLAATGLTIGSNYILGIEYDTVVDPTFRATFSSTVNAPVANVPEPVTLSLLGAGLAGAAAIRRRKAKKA